jgi:cation transport ATPase
MKKLIVLVALLISAVGFSQDKNAKATIKVDGVCEMCKSRIEKACIKTKGVKYADWNVQTHELALIYNENTTSLDVIKVNITEVGHDVDGMKASDEAYDQLHDCCKYRDEAVRAAH